MSGPIGMRKHLDADLAPPNLPAGTQFIALSAIAPAALHAILADAYATGFGRVASLEEWWSAVTSDGEFDPALVFIVADDNGDAIGMAQCWTSGYVKDVAVSPAWRGKGIGEALLITAFQAFRQRGVEHVDLKVVPGNDAAVRLYRRLGMLEVPL